MAGSPLVFALLGLLGVSVMAFCALGLLRMRTAKALARKAHQAGLRFSAEDPFDLPRRCSHLALLRAGHSPLAENVTYGRVGGRLLRAFQFRFEVGHGPRRLIRHYGVILLESRCTLSRTVLWHGASETAPPPEVLEGSRRIGEWTCSGDPVLAGALEAAGAAVAEPGVGMETGGQSVVLFLPVKRRGPDYLDRLPEALSMVRALEGLRAIGAD